MNSVKKKKIVIVGGGITGLTTAFYLKQQAKHQDISVDIVIIESSLRLGGKIQTYRDRGFVIERGPESFLDTTGAVRQLAKQLQIERLLKRHQIGQSYLVIRSGVFPIPSKMSLGEEVKFSSLVKSGILSVPGKLRASADLILPKANEPDDEPITDFFSRRFGEEFVENIVEPLLAATFAGDIDHLSIQSMFPRFYELEKKHRSIILGMKKTKMYPILQGEDEMHYETFENGLESLVEQLEQQLEGVQILKGVKVIGMDQHDNQVMLHLNNIASFKADRVIMTTPFSVSQKIFKKHNLLQRVPGMKSATIATVNMAFKSEDIPKLKNAINFFVARSSGLTITSCTWSSRKWANSAPEGYELLRLYIGRAGDEAIVELSDNEIERAILNDLHKVLGVTIRPKFTVVTRWKH
ncbi:MAG: protoporphyrinogen oxidase, partial [Lysinibacillus sp.]